MANATVITKTIKEAVVIPAVTEQTVTLDLSLEQAQALRAVLGRTTVKVNETIGTNDIYIALERAGIRPSAKVKNYKIVQQDYPGW